MYQLQRVVERGVWTKGSYGVKSLWSLNLAILGSSIGSEWRREPGYRSVRGSGQSGRDTWKECRRGLVVGDTVTTSRQ